MAHHRETPIEISKQEFKEIGHQLIDTISEFIDSIEEKPVTSAETSEQLQKLLGNTSLPVNGTSASELMSKTADLILNHSLLNGHPKFLGYITSSAAPIGALADLLAAAVNPNVGAQILSPIATEIEKQTIQWLAEFINVSTSYGGILVSGGNMANFTAFLAARTAKAPKNYKEDGLEQASVKLVVYCSRTTHTWIEKAAILFGHGTKSIRWIEADAENKMDNGALEEAVIDDLKKGYKPFLVVGTAGDVSTGAVDHLDAISTICKAHDLWFHIDGAYGIPAAVLPEFKTLFAGIEQADSIALDPHKWLYNPLEVGCTLVKNPRHLTDTYSSHPDYYNFSGNDEDQAQNYYEYGLQNSRGFRALKVWITLQQVGKNGYARMIAEDIELAGLLFENAKNHSDLEAITHSLSITTFRYVPTDYNRERKNRTAYLNTLNEKLLNVLQEGGELFLSNAIVNEMYCLRACIVNFRTSKKDIEEIIEIVVREGAKVHEKLQEKLEQDRI
jgi:aromatic-L-amino-acid/L-tryptophan decarboxylase